MNHNENQSLKGLTLNLFNLQITNFWIGKLACWKLNIFGIKKFVKYFQYEETQSDFYKIYLILS